MTRDEFQVRWQTRHDELERLGAHVDGARLCLEVLLDFAAVCSTDDEELLNLEDAHAFSGYSKDRLRKLASEGKLPVAKRGRRLYFRRKDLPRKPHAVDVSPARPYDPVADARRVATLLEE